MEKDLENRARELTEEESAQVAGGMGEIDLRKEAEARLRDRLMPEQSPGALSKHTQPMHHVRDVDIAKKTVEYTKNNVLTQAAQSMLSQANSCPPDL